MGICSSIAGTGLRGALGSAASAIGGAVGIALGADAISRAITGYGLLESLSVPYIECDDGHFASAIEWYSNGLKCGKPPAPPTPPGSSHGPASPGGSQQSNALRNYKNSLPPGSEIAVGVAASALIQYRGLGTLFSSQTTGGMIPGNPGGLPIKASGASQDITPDKFGNQIKINESLFNSGSTGYVTYVGGLYYLEADTKTSIPSTDFTPGGDPLRSDWDRVRVYGGVSNGDDASFENAMLLLDQGYGITGVKVTLPPGQNAPRFNLGGGWPPEPSKHEKKDCEDMANCCITQADIERAVKRALGLDYPISPEAMIAKIGSAMYGGTSGRSGYSFVPPDLVTAIAALNAPTYMRLGLHRFPAKVPKSMLDDGKAVELPEVIEEYGQWFEWFIKQFDALMGEWPIDIQIKDKNGSKPLKFENLAECLSELTGLIVQTAVDADTGVNMGSHAVVEASKAGNAAIIAQRNADILISFFGIRTDGDIIEVKSTITPGKLDEANNSQDGHGIAEFLQPSIQYLQVRKETDPFDFQAVMQRILQNSEMARQAVYHEVNPDKGKNGMTGDYIRRQKAYDKQEPPEKLRAYKKAIEDKYNNDPNSPIRIEIDRIPENLPDVVGDNFVIRRPKTET